MRKKILIIDDNTELLELLRLAVKQAGFSVMTATNGVDALDQAKAKAPDLIVLDLVLPEMDGFAVCEVLRRNPATATIPIILLTGLSSEFSRYAGIESGADEYVTKPASPEHLVSRIRYWLQHPPAARAEHTEFRTRLARSEAY